MRRAAGVATLAAMTGKLRIIGGLWRGRRLALADRPGLRPTGDRARETLFNWLQGRIHRASALDLFAGSGALGLEAASRGAAQVVLVERDRALTDSLRALVGEWPDTDTLRVVGDDALRWLEGAEGRFDLVFVDPPFDQRLHARVLQKLSRPGLLAIDARVYVESPAREPAPVVAGDRQWRILKEKRQGEVRLQLVAPQNPAPSAALPPIPGA